jgi:hypothetical protein
MDANEKLKDVLNVLENVIPKSYDPQEPCDIEDLLKTVLARVNLAKDIIIKSIESENVEPLSEMSRAEIQLNIMRNIEREIMMMYPRSSFAYWWKHTVNWHKVQTFINGNTSKMGATSSAVQSRFIGANPDGKTFISEAPK